MSAGNAGDLDPKFNTSQESGQSQSENPLDHFNPYDESDYMRSHIRAAADFISTTPNLSEAQKQILLETGIIPLHVGTSAEKREEALRKAANEESYMMRVITNAEKALETLGGMEGVLDAATAKGGTMIDEETGQALYWWFSKRLHEDDLTPAKSKKGGRKKKEFNQREEISIRRELNFIRDLGDSVAVLELITHSKSLKIAPNTTRFIGNTHEYRLGTFTKQELQELKEAKKY